MKAIWKFDLKVTDEQIVQIPDGAQLLTVQTQNEIPCLWALVDPKAEKMPCHIQIFGTGHPVHDAGKYLSTFQLGGGSFIGHVFVKN